MFTIKEYEMPNTVEEAYQLLMAKRMNHIIGGCAWLRMGNKRISQAIDLTNLGLNFINETDDAIEIGAMTSYRQIETSELLKSHFDGILSECVKPIVGVQFRNTVTVGGSVFSRFGFSDFLPPLLVLDTYVELYNEGIIPLKDFMEMPYKKDLLIKIIIKKNSGHANYQTIRLTKTDFPIINVAVYHEEKQWKISVGARSGKAKLAEKTASYLTNADLSDLENVCKKAGELLVDEIIFNSNVKASKEYRQAMAQTLLKRGIMEVLSC